MFGYNKLYAINYKYYWLELEKKLEQKKKK